MKPCPEELLKNERFAFIKGRPKMLGSPHKFAKRGECGAWVSDLLPLFAEHVDDVAIIRSMVTDQFNHAPAELLIYTGAPRNGGAAMGAWITYGLGSENENLPGFVVLISGGTDPTGGKALWSTGFLPTVYQGVQCRTLGDPVLYVSDPKGMSRDSRRKSLDAIKALNEFELARTGRSRDFDADQSIRARVSNADGGARRDGYLQGAGTAPRVLRRQAGRELVRE